MSGIRDIMQWKSTVAVLWSVALEAALLVVLVCVDINLLSPVTWMQALSTVISIKLWICFLPLAGITIAQGMMQSRKYLTPPTFSSTRFDIVRNLFTWHNCLMSVILPFMSFAVTWTFLSAVGKEHHVSGPCKSSQTCVAEGYVYLVLAGIWSGTHFFLSNYIWDSNILVFPVVQQLKFIDVKSKLLLSLKKAMYEAIWPNLYFILFFYLKSEDIYELCSLSVARSEFEVSLIIHAWLFTTIFIFTILTSRHLLQVYLTEHWQFPITGTSVLEAPVTLHQALAMKEQPLIQSLGCYDLMMVAGRYICRRRELFSLSQPGGHPHNWNALIKEVLKLIDSFTSDLNTANLETLNSSRTSLNRPSASLVTTEHLHLHSLRNLSMPAVPVQQDDQLSAPIPLWDFFSDLLKKRLVQFSDALWKKPAVRFVFGDIPDAKLRYVLSQSPQIIWAAQGTACLAATSLNEDKYGVVLKDLRALVLSLVNLKQALDKIPKTGNLKRSQKNEQDEIKVKISLKSAVKRGLYNICLAYGDSILQLDLPKTVQCQLQLYLSFREG